MNNSNAPIDIDSLIERIKTHPAVSLTGKVAPWLPELNRAVSMRLITWLDIAQRLEVPYTSLHAAKSRAVKLRAKWVAQGIIEPQVMAKTPERTPVVEQSKEVPGSVQSLLGLNADQSRAAVDDRLGKFEKLPDYSNPSEK